MLLLTFSLQPERIFQVTRGRDHIDWNNGEGRKKTDIILHYLSHIHFSFLKQFLEETYGFIIKRTYAMTLKKK